MHYLLTVILAVGVWAWITAHQLIVYYVFSVLIEQLPPATPQSSPFYRYAYSVIQLLAANWRRSKDAVIQPTTPVEKKP